MRPRYTERNTKLDMAQTDNRQGVALPDKQTEGGNK